MEPKKKEWFTVNLETYFPEYFYNPSQGLDQRKAKKRYLLAYADFLSDSENDNFKKSYEEATFELLRLNKPVPLDSGADSYLLEYERKNMEVIGALLEQGIQQPKKLSVFEFYSLLNRYRKLNEIHNKNGRSNQH